MAALTWATKRTRARDRRPIGFIGTYALSIPARTHTNPSPTSAPLLVAAEKDKNTAQIRALHRVLQSPLAPPSSRLCMPTRLPPDPRASARCSRSATSLRLTTSSLEWRRQRRHLDHQLRFYSAPKQCRALCSYTWIARNTHGSLYDRVHIPRRLRAGAQ